MKLSFTHFFVVLIFVFNHSLFAISAFPGELTFTQNDGSTFKGHLVGDEWLHFVSLENDYVAIYNKDKKNYEYALIETIDGKSKLVSSGQEVKESLHLSNPKNLALTIPPLNKNTLSHLERKSPKHTFHKQTHTKDKNISHKDKKILNTKSTQWKEVLKEKSPSK